MSSIFVEVGLTHFLKTRECFVRAPCPQLVVGYGLSVSLQLPLALGVALSLALTLALALLLTS